MNHIIKLLFLCLFLVASCSQEEINEVLKNHAEMEEQANSIEELCKNMNRDIVALKLIIDSSESGDYITGFQRTLRMEAAIRSVSLRVAPLSSRMARKEMTARKGKTVKMVRMVRTAPMAKMVRMVPMAKTELMVPAARMVRMVPMVKTELTVRMVKTVRKEIREKMV